MGHAAVHPDPVRIRLRDVSVVRCVSDSPELEVQVIIPAPNQRGVEEEAEVGLAEEHDELCESHARRRLDARGTRVGAASGDDTGR